MLPLLAMLVLLGEVLELERIAGTVCSATTLHLHSNRCISIAGRISARTTVTLNHTKYVISLTSKSEPGFKLTFSKTAK